MSPARTRTPRSRKAAAAGPAVDPTVAEATVVVLPEDLTVQAAEQVRATLLAALAGAGRLVLDASAVVELDTAGLQVLLLVAREARAGGKVVELAPTSPAVDEVLALTRVGTGLEARR